MSERSLASVSASDVSHAPTAMLPPTPDPDSAHWWEGLEREEVRAQSCHNCDIVWAPATAMCPECGARDFEWSTLSGRGRIYSWVVVRQALDPAFADDVPYTIAVVQMDEGPRMLGRLLEGAGAIDLPVCSQVYRVDGQALLGFVPE